MPLAQDEVQTLLRRYQETYEAADPGFFDLFTRDATFFTVSSPTRIDGLEEFRRGFEPDFTRGGVTRRLQILTPEIRILDNAAVATFHARISADGQLSNLRSTLTIVQEQGGALRIAHLHNSPQAAPTVPIPFAARTVDEIRLLEERVATAAATVGTPK